jgi:exodeoxyribonuclease-3
LYFCGDLNVAHTELDLAKPKENVGTHGFTNEEREGIDAMIASGFIDSFREANPDATNGNYSWWSHFGNARARNVGWRIDYVFVDDRLQKNITHAAIHPDILGSDHCPVSVTLSL